MGRVANKVSFLAVVQALQFSNPGTPVYVDTTTGAIVSAPEDGVDESESRRTAPELEPGRFEPLPVISQEHELQLAAQFCRQVGRVEDRQRLELALAATDAAEQFETALFRCKIAHEWFRFRDQHLSELAKSWLAARGIEYVDDLT